jgi:hypothetical protein
VQSELPVDGQQSAPGRGGAIGLSGFIHHGDHQDVALSKALASPPAVEWGPELAAIAAERGNREQQSLRPYTTR